MSEAALSCRILCRILANTAKEPNGQGCVRMEWMLLSRVRLELHEWVRA